MVVTLEGMLTLARELQPEKAEEPILVTPVAMLTLVSALHP